MKINFKKLTTKLKLDKEVLRKIILIISLLVFIYSAYMIGSYYFDAYRNWKLYQDVNRRILESEQHNQKVFYDYSFDQLLRKVVLDEEEDTGKPDRSEVLSKFRTLLEDNEDTVGWIYIPNTKKIDYPVVKYSDNAFYLDHNFLKQKNSAGAIFMDYRNKGDGNDKHTILYGHNMRYGDMFKGTLKYSDKDFFESNRIIYFSTLYEELEWEVFSAYTTEIAFNYIKTRFNTPDEHISFLRSIQNKSMYKTDIELSEDDLILTLSTCTYDYSDARFVVHARLVR